MKNIKRAFQIWIIAVFFCALNACTKNFEDINKNPNNPSLVPTATIFNGANRYLFSSTREGFWMGRMSMPWMQYSSQNNYLEEDKYQYRDNQTNNGWLALYRVAFNLKEVIQKCEDPSLEVEMSKTGNLKNQVAVSRIMLAYVFDVLVTHFGDIPYWSYGQKNNPDFQALDIEKYLTPAYVSQEVVYKDLLKELKEASAQLTTDRAFLAGDNIYPIASSSGWKKFANSLRLRIANRIKKVYPAAVDEMKDAIQAGVFTSNADNAIHRSGSTNVEGNPFWRTFFVGNRNDFWPNQSFINLLKGTTGGFGFDPRLYKIAAPNNLTFIQYMAEPRYQDQTDMKRYTGMPYGLPKTEAYFTTEANLNFFSRDVLKINRPDVLMEYAEVEFILSEMNGWSKDHYVKAVRANLEYLEVPNAQIMEYLSRLPAANERNVLTQKYICLFNNPDESWNEYRRTGFPDREVLLMPGATGTRPNNGSTYVFTPLQSGNVIAKDLPARVRYPTTQQTLNPINWKATAAKLGGDEIDKKLWFAK